MKRRHSTKKLRLFNTNQSPIFSFIVLLLVSFLLMGLDYRKEIQPDIKQFRSYIKPPLIYFLNLPNKISESVKETLTTKSALLEEKIQLENSMIELSIENQKLIFLEAENSILRNSMKIANNLAIKSISAEIILPTVINGKRSIIINKGQNDGIQVGSPVINNLGLVGQVILTEKNYSEVAPITAREYIVPAILEKGTDNVILRGTGSGYLEIKMFPSHRVAKIGEQFMTSGIDGIYPKGIKIGNIIDIKPVVTNQFNHLLIAPTSDPTTHSQVRVFLGGIK